MTTATTARSLADDDDDVSKMMSAGDITELTESERDFRLKTEDQLECDEEEQKRLDELLTQCRDYIYACHSQSHVTSSKIITNGSLTSRSPSSPRDVTSSVMAACWLELPVSSSRDAFPFPANDVVDHSDVTSHIHSYNDRAYTAEAEVVSRRDDVIESRVSQLNVLRRRIDDVISLRVDAVKELKSELSAVEEANWNDDVTELETCRTHLDDVKRRQLDLMVHADNERKQTEQQLAAEKQKLNSVKQRLTTTTTTKSTDVQRQQLQHDVETQQRYLEDLEFQLLELETRREVEREPQLCQLVSQHTHLQQRINDVQKSLCQQRQCKLELVAQAKADIRHLDAEYHLLLDSVRQEKEKLVELNYVTDSTSEAAPTDLRLPRDLCQLSANELQARRGQRSTKTSATDDEDDDDDDIWQTILQLEENISRDQPWNNSGDVTGHVEDKAAAVIADDDDVDELSSSDVSSDVRHNNLTSSTDDNTASCSCSTDTVNDSSAHDECHQQNDRRDDDNDDDDDDGTSSQQRTTRPTRAVDTEHDSTTPSGRDEKQCITAVKSRRLPDIPPTSATHYQTVTLRARRSSQCRPLTRYLPVRDSSFNLRQFIESSGHSVEDHTSSVHLTSTTCQGALSKMTRRGLIHTWHRRWFVFDRAHRTLSWHSSRPHSAVCRRSRHTVSFSDIVDVFLDHLRSVRSPAPHLTFCVKTDTECIYLVAPSAAVLRIWVDVIVTGAEGYQQFW